MHLGAVAGELPDFRAFEFWHSTGSTGAPGLITTTLPELATSWHFAPLME